MTQLSSTKNTSELIVSDAISKLTEQPIFPPPPYWLLRFALWFRIGFACFLLLGCLLGLTGCAGRVLALNGQPLQWTDARQTTPLVLQQAFDDLTIASREEQPNLPVLASTLKGQQGQTIVFNFSKVPQLCGAAGCLFAAYAQIPEVALPALSDAVPESYRLVWTQYLRSSLPKGMPLLLQYTPPDQSDESFPALVANQVENNRIRQLVFSWSGRRYEMEKTILNEQLVE
ncbi:MAG: hypothetical protein NW224_12995 [Leptolyngbyaceae cyanobacterium bins.302]|nr:hypothetical protein [Leptolyngbyaceae cyanobacterium bins.302]